MQTHSQIDVACDTLCVNLTAKLLHVVVSTIDSLLLRVGACC